MRRKTTPSPSRAQPKASAVSGESAPRSDGCQRLIAKCSEGAVAEMEGSELIRTLGTVALTLDSCCRAPSIARPSGFRSSSRSSRSERDPRGASVSLRRAAREYQEHSFGPKGNLIALTWSRPCNAHGLLQLVGVHHGTLKIRILETRATWSCFCTCVRTRRRISPYVVDPMAQLAPAAYFARPSYESCRFDLAQK